MPFENLSAVVKIKLDSDQFAFYAEEHVRVLKQLCLKTAAVCLAFHDPVAFHAHPVVAQHVMVPQAPIRERRLTAVFLK